MNWKLCVDGSEKRALKICRGSMDEGTGWGFGFGYGQPDGSDGQGWVINLGEGASRAADVCGDGYGDGRGDGYSSSEWK